MREIENLVLTEYSLPIPDYSRWARESAGKGYVQRMATSHSPSAKSLILTTAHLPSFLPTDEGVTISAHYVASTAMAEITAGDTRGKPSSTPLKTLVAGFGIGHYGRNGIISIPGIGTRVSFRAIESELEPMGDYVWDDTYGLSPECENCDKCVKNCPVGALPGDSTVTFDVCVRSQSNGGLYPEQIREKIFGSIWGCEECQRVCPRNESVAAQPMPKGLASALELSRLLSGDVAPLGEWIGAGAVKNTNFTTIAAIVAANLGRTELISNIEKLLTSDNAGESEAATWALAKLRG